MTDRSIPPADGMMMNTHIVRIIKVFRIIVCEVGNYYTVLITSMDDFTTTLHQNADIPTGQ